MSDEREMIHRALNAFAEDLLKQARSHKYTGASFAEVRADLRTRAVAFQRLAVKYARPLRECAHCGRMCGDYAGGYGTIPVGETDAYVCHPNEPGRPDCYRLVTVYHQPLGYLKGMS